MHMLHTQTPQIKRMTQKALVHACRVCITVLSAGYTGGQCEKSADMKGRRERDIVRPPAPVQITPELPTSTAFYSGI